MADESQERIFALLDLLSVEVAQGRKDVAEFRIEIRQELRNEIGSLRNEVRSGFERIDRRFGRLETRVEGVENEQRSFRLEFERRIAPLEG